MVELLNQGLSTLWLSHKQPRDALFMIACYDIRGN